MGGKSKDRHFFYMSSILQFVSASDFMMNCLMAVETFHSKHEEETLGSNKVNMTYSPGTMDGCNNPKATLLTWLIFSKQI